MFVGGFLESPHYCGTVFYGDGVYDDQPAIMAAIAAAEAAYT